MTVDHADRTVQLAREMKKLLTEKENLTFAAHICQKRLDEIRLTELPEAMDNAGMSVPYTSGPICLLASQPPLKRRRGLGW